MERRRDRNQRAQQRLSDTDMGTAETTSKPPGSGAVDAGASRAAFCRYLTSAREASGKSLQEIATITRIPARSLERLESGAFEDLPADVFVRGFLRSYARCVGMDQNEAVKRYSQCGMTPAPVSSAMAEELASTLATLESSPGVGYRSIRAVRADTLGTTDTVEEHSPDVANPAEHSPVVANPAEHSPVVAAPPVLQASSEPLAKQSGDASPTNVPASESDESRPTRAKKRKRRNRKARDPIAAAPATGTEVARTAESARPTDESTTDQSTTIERTGALPDRAATPIAAMMHAPAQESTSEDNTADTVADTTPITARAPVSNSVARQPTPVLRIDDDCPEQADTEREARVEREREREDNAWKNFLPPSLLDSEEGSHRGALTLAVIILVIVATLTMSYLLRRPSHSGDGVTRIEGPATQPGQLAWSAVADNAHAPSANSNHHPAG